MSVPTQKRYMEIQLRFFATFRDAVGRKTVSRSIESDVTVGEVLESLEAEYDGLEGRLLENGSVAQHLSVLKNGRDVTHLDGVDTDLDDGDVLSVFPPVAGG